MAQDERTRITIEIYNTLYTIVGKESASHVRLIAGLVDDKMREIQSGNQQYDTKMLAVLTAVNSMNDYVKLQEQYAALLQSLDKEEDQ